MTDPIVTCPACDTNHEIHGLDTRITMYVHRTDKHGRAVSFHCGCNNCRNRLGRGGVNMSYEGKWCKCSEEAYQPHVWSGNCVICKLPKNGSPHTSNHYYKKEMPNTITIAALDSRSETMNSLAALKSSATTFLKFFLAQAVYVGMVTVNWRAISAANIPKSLISEMAISAGSFFVVRQIAKGGSGIISGAGFVAGATTGMYLALRYFG